MSELKELNFELELETRESTELELNTTIAGLIDEKHMLMGQIDEYIQEIEQKETLAAVAAVQHDKSEWIKDLEEQVSFLQEENGELWGALDKQKHHIDRLLQ